MSFYSELARPTNMSDLSIGPSEIVYDWSSSRFSSPSANLKVLLALGPDCCLLLPDSI